jgi:hypothetical protein
MAEAFNDNGRPKGREEVEEAMDGKEEVKKNRTASTCMGGGPIFPPIAYHARHSVIQDYHHPAFRFINNTRSQ